MKTYLKDLASYISTPPQVSMRGQTSQHPGLRLTCAGWGVLASEALTKVQGMVYRAPREGRFSMLLIFFSDYYS